MERILLILSSCTNIVDTISLVEKLQKPSSLVTALYILDSGWRDILGDEWLSTSTSRKNFFRYMEGNYCQEANKLVDHLKQYATVKKISVNTLIKTGSPHKLVVSTFIDHGPFDLVILPADGNKKLKAEALAQELSCPVMITPS